MLAVIVITIHWKSRIELLFLFRRCISSGLRKIHNPFKSQLWDKKETPCWIDVYILVFRFRFNSVPLPKEPFHIPQDRSEKARDPKLVWEIWNIVRLCLNVWVVFSYRIKEILFSFHFPAFLCIRITQHALNYLVERLFGIHYWEF